MARRAAAIPEGQAPFWQLIEYGNPSELFPTPPTNFISEAEIKIKKVVDSAIRENCDMLRKKVDEASLASVNLSGITPKSRELFEGEDENIYNYLKDVARVEQIKEMKTYGVIRELNSYNVIKTTSGKAGLQFNIGKWKQEHRGS
jgi:hypothetical protein